MPKASETVLEVDLNALKFNYQYLKSRLSKKTKFLAVVKAFAYGSDPILVAKKLESLGVDYFAVAYTNEGVALRQAGIETPILVLHPLEVNLENIIENCLEPNLYAPKILSSFLTLAAKKNQIDYPVHIKFNTGLNRLGFEETDVTLIGNLLNQSDNVKLKSVFSHLAASEDNSENEFTLEQIRKFNQIGREVSKTIGYAPWKHQLNTSGIFNYPEAQFDMVRCGIGLFGFANEKVFTEKLKPVLAFKTIISQIHTIEVGESVGYNRNFIANEPMKMATLPAGHADGIHRAFGNRRGFVMIHDQKAEIIGNVCMDMIMVDITTIACSEGDEVIIFKDQSAVNELASRIDTISYELITAISQRVKRIVK